MDTEERPTARLRRLAEQRVGDLGMTLTQFQEENDIGRGLWHRWRDGESVRTINDHRIHAALGWEPRSRQDILEGGEPTLSPEPPPVVHREQGGPAGDPYEDRWLEEFRRVRGRSRADQAFVLSALQAMLDGLEAQDSENGAGNGRENGE